MPLTPSEVVNFSKALEDAFLWDRFQMLVYVTTGRMIDYYMSLSIAGTLRYIQVVDGISREGKERKLLENAVLENPTNPNLQAFKEAYDDTALPMPPDPFDSPLMRANRLFINRSDLRERLRELKSAAAARVLMVRGDRFSGKSHTRFFVDHLAQFIGGFRAVMIHLVDEAIDKPAELALAIFSKIGGDEMQLPDKEAAQVTSVARWGQILTKAIRNEIKRRGTHVWLVFDGLAKDGLPKETLSVILDLAKQAELEIEELRVVMLGFSKADPRPTGTSWPPEIDEALSEEIDVIDETHCVQWLKDSLELVGKPGTESAMKVAIANIFQSLPPPGKFRLEKLGQEMRKLVDEMKRTPPAAALTPGDGP